jgi:hypothetical protein
VGYKLAVLVCILGGLSVTGCSLFHHGDVPQQQFLEALNRGNGAQATQIWLHMSAKDRAKLSHSVGVTPHFSKDELQAQVLKHQEQEAKEADDQDSDTGSIEEGNINSEIIDMPGADVDTKSGSLLNLPNLAPSEQPVPLAPEPDLQQ